MKMFTYAGNVSTGDKNKWSKKVVHRSRRYRWWGGTSAKGAPAIALLLHTDDTNDPITDKDLADFAKSDVVKRLFPNGFIATPSDVVESDWLLSASAKYAELPDAAQLDSPKLRVLMDDVIQDIDLRQRYNNCRSLLKAVGCNECPEKGMACLSRELSVQARETLPDRAEDEDTFKETLKNRKTTVGAFTYISPSLTIPDDHHFVPSLRHYEDHDFENIETNSEKISEKNKRTAADRKFKQENCSRCPLQKSCTSFRSCAGPYPSSDLITAEVMETWRERIEVPKPFEPWQFWALARSGGLEGKYRRSANSRYGVTLHGLDHHYRDGWRVVLWRSRTEFARLTDISDYETLRGIFPGLPDTKEDAERRGIVRPENNAAIALYLMLTEHSRSMRYRGGWGGDYYGILYKSLGESGTHIRFCGPRYSRHSTTIDSYAKFYAEITHRIGVKQIPVRTGLKVYSND